MAKTTVKTRAIVLNAIKYGDSSLVVKMLTEEEGLQSFMVKGVFGKKSKMKAAMFQNMTLLNIVAEIGSNSLGFVKEVTLSHYYKSVTSDIKKSSIMLFVSELLSKSITETEVDFALFDYVYNSMLWLDDAESDYVNFPVVFALNLTKYLGFYPNFDTYVKGSCFDMLDGNFKLTQNGIYQIDQELSYTLFHLGAHELSNSGVQNVEINNRIRHFLLDAIVTYYKLHSSDFRDMKSYEVLRTVLSV